MSNNPNDKPTAEEAMPEQVREIANAQAAYEEVLNAITSVLIKRRVRANASELEIIMDSVSDLFYHDCDHALTALAEAGYNEDVQPENRSKLCEEAEERIIDTFRIKPLNFSDELFQALRPFPQNIATYIQTGKDVQS